MQLTWLRVAESGCALSGEPDREKLKEYGMKEWEWLQAMATIPGLSVTTGGGSGMTPDTAWSHQHMLKRLDQITEAGGDMMITPMMRLGTLFMGIKGEGLNPLLASPSFKELHTHFGGRCTDEMLHELQTDTNLRQAITAELNEVRNGAYGTHFIGRPDMRQWVWPWSTSPENAKEDSLEFAPDREGKTVWEYVYDVMVHPEQSHGGVLVRPLYNYGAHSMEPLADMFVHDRVVAGFADGGAHGKGQCEATTPTTMITFWCRDRTAGSQLPIEMVVKKQTKDSVRHHLCLCISTAFVAKTVHVLAGFQANMMGFTDRGELLPGMKADLNVFDLKTLDVLAPVTNS